MLNVTERIRLVGQNTTLKLSSFSSTFVLRSNEPLFIYVDGRHGCQRVNRPFFFHPDRSGYSLNKNINPLSVKVVTLGIIITVERLSTDYYRKFGLGSPEERNEFESATRRRVPTIPRVCIKSPD